VALFELGDHMANNDDTTVPIHKLPPRSKTKQPIEDHFDDCGDDISSILLPPSDDETKATQLAFHFDADPLDVTDTELHDNVLHETFDNNFTQHYFHGSDFDEQQPLPIPPRAIIVTDVCGLMMYLQKAHVTGSVDVVEICGGVGGVLRMSVRYNLKQGPNI